MSKTAVICRASFEIVTQYLTAFTSPLLDYANQQGYTVTSLFDDDSKKPARTIAFEPAMETKPPPNILIAVGHGNKTHMTGQDYEVLIQTDLNDDICKNTQTYLWACETGATLGPRLVEKGCPAYYGYQADWTFLYHDDYYQRFLNSVEDYTLLLDDPYAKGFFDSGLATAYSLLVGKTPAEIYGDTIGRYTYWYEWWKTQNDKMASQICTWLNWNRSNFIVSTSNGLYEGSPASAQAGINIPAVILPLGVAGALLFLLAEKI